MAEQINKNDYINHPDRIGGFNYYSLGETTIKQLQQNNLILTNPPYVVNGSGDMKALATATGLYKCWGIGT